MCLVLQQAELEIFGTNDLLICITLTIYIMTPCSCFHTEMSIDEVNHTKHIFTLTRYEVVTPNAA